MNEFNENHSGSGNGLISLILLVIIVLLVYQIYRMESIFKLITQDGIEVAEPVGDTSDKGKKDASVVIGDKTISNKESVSKQSQSDNGKSHASNNKVQEQNKGQASNNKVQEQSKPTTTTKRSGPQRLTKDQINVSVKAKVENRYIERTSNYPIRKDGITGNVTLNITVTQFGEVTKVSLNPASTIKDEDIIDSCKECALKMRISSNYDSPSRQTGTITYTFAPR